MPFLPLYFQQLGVTDVGEVALWSGLSLGVTPAVTALMAPLWGRLADRVGRRLVFVIGLVIFTIASVLCGLAGTPLTLNLARALQGIGGAFMFATSLALLASAYSGRDRGTAFGLWGATTGAAVAIGPLVGGVLTEGIGWEAIFFVNVPIGIVAVALTLARVEESKNPHAGPLDWPGTVLFSGALFLLIFGLIRGNPEGWESAPIVASLAGAVVLLAAFVLVERRRREHAMLDLGLFKVPSFVGASVAAFVLSASMFFTYVRSNAAFIGRMSRSASAMPSMCLPDSRTPALVAAT